MDQYSMKNIQASGQTKLPCFSLISLGWVCACEGLHLNLLESLLLCPLVTSHDFSAKLKHLANIHWDEGNEWHTFTDC